MERFTLLAMAPSGETYLARDQYGHTWLFQPRAVGEPESVEAEVVDRAVAFGGFDRVDEAFDSWAELDRFRQERAALVAPDVVVDRAVLDEDDVAEMLGVARRWIDDGQGGRARRAVLALLRLPIARAKASVHDDLLAVLDQLEQPPAEFLSEPSDEQRVVRKRWKTVTSV